MLGERPTQSWSILHFLPYIAYFDGLLTACSTSSSITRPNCSRYNAHSKSILGNSALGELKHTLLIKAKKGHYFNTHRVFTSYHLSLSHWSQVDSEIVGLGKSLISKMASFNPHCILQWGLKDTILTKDVGTSIWHQSWIEFV